MAATFQIFLIRVQSISFSLDSQRKFVFSSKLFRKIKAVIRTGIVLRRKLGAKIKDMFVMMQIPEAEFNCCVLFYYLVSLISNLHLRSFSLVYCNFAIKYRIPRSIHRCKYKHVCVLVFVRLRL